MITIHGDNLLDIKKQLLIPQDQKQVFKESHGVRLKSISFDEIVISISKAYKDLNVFLIYED